MEKKIFWLPTNDGENYKCTWLYKNNSTPGNPSWSFQSDTFFTAQSIDIGTAAYPQFFDYNKDGKPDLFIGSDGYYQSNDSLRSRVSYYLNYQYTRQILLLHYRQRFSWCERQ